MNGFQRGPSSVSLGLLHMQEDLNLSEEQINHLEDTAQQSQREMITLRSQRKLTATGSAPVDAAGNL